MAISGNAPNPSHDPYALTAYAPHSQPNRRPSLRLLTREKLAGQRTEAQTTAARPCHN
jgi:hypothetical protein